MHLSKTLHPPGGATALIAVTGGEGIRQLGYLYAFVPCLTGACLMLGIALVVNNLSAARRYPLYWW
ncbi:HPP family protein [uncultured Desulfovibrio sp.]|uniref:HPP family protein n=1 Tax=uncultured Desulfovibrio sp. TaxID=167968 RepID=UPI00344819B2